MTKKAVGISIISLAVAGSFLGSFKAYSVFKKNAPQIQMHIAASLPTTVKHKITYYLPKSDDSTYTQFVSNTIEVNEGTNIYSALNDYTSNIEGFSFVDWHSSSSHFRNDDEIQDKISSDSTLTEDVTVYAKYIKANTLYYCNGTDDHHYYNISMMTDQTVSTRYAFVGDRIYSYNGVEGSQYDLLTNSGIYRFQLNGNNWSILRKVTFGINDVSSWWTNGAQCHIYYENTSNEVKWHTNVQFDGNKVTYFFEHNVNKFIVCRSPSGGCDWSDFSNKTVDAYLDNADTGQEKYSSTYNVLYVQDSRISDQQHHINWWE